MQPITLGPRDPFYSTTMIERSEMTFWKWTVTGGVICAFLVVDLITPILWNYTDIGWIICVATGICIGQINLIATWAALAPGNIVLRLPWALLLAVLMWYILVIGNQVERGNYSLDEAVTLGWILVFAVVIAQISLWIAGKVFRWRLVSWAADAKHSVAGDFQFQIRHVLLGMVLLSLTLAPARWVLPVGDITTLHLDRELMVILPAIAICNLLITVPCIWGAFLDAQLLIPLACGWLLYCGFLSAVEFGLLGVILGPPGDWEVMFYLFVLNSAQCAAVFVTLLIFQALGVRLLRVKSLLS